MSPRAGDVMGYHVRGCAMLGVWIFKTAARFSSDCLYYSIESNSIAHAEPVSESPRPVRWRETVRSAVRRGDLPEPRYAANTQPCRLTIPASWLPVWKLLPTSSKPSSSTGKAGKAGRSVPTTALFPTGFCASLGLPRPESGSATTEDNDYVFERFVRNYDIGGNPATRRIDLYKKGCFVVEAKQSRQSGRRTNVPAAAYRVATTTKPRGRPQNMQRTASPPARQASPGRAIPRPQGRLRNRRLS